jgi:H+/Cl- antiporter ClcA
VIIGTVSGLLGALFININFRINALRGVYSDKPWKKLFEAAFFAFISASAFYWFPYLFRTCLDNKQNSTGIAFKDKTETIWDKSSDYDISRGWCEEG